VKKPRVRVAGPLSPHINCFARSLGAQGFTHLSIDCQIRLVKHFSLWLLQKHVDAKDIAPEHADAYFKDRRPNRGDRAVLKRLMAMLREEGINAHSSVPVELGPTPVQQVVDAYASYLRQERRLADTTLIYYLSYARTFLTERYGTGPVKLSDLGAIDVIHFVQRQAKRLSQQRARMMTIALRAFLRYAMYLGDIRIDLTTAVPAVANWTMTSIPRAISADDVRMVLAQCKRDTATGCRDYAILLLLARLGLRSGEVRMLTLDNIDWENGCIKLTGKGGKPARLPLPVDVGEAIAGYLQHWRPAGSCRALFLRSRAPVGAFKTQQGIGNVVRHALVRAGIESPRHGAHQFRHGLACEMLRQGATLTEIGELLRHSNPQTTSIYAKADLPALRTLSLPWPEKI
jgi:integrase/recombinase XerD